MHRAWISWKILIIALVYSALVAGDSLQPGNEIAISLIDFNPSLMNGQAFHNYSLLNPMTQSFIVIPNIPSEVSFIIIQVHTQESNVTLFYNGTKTTNISGNNVGLYINSSDISHTDMSVVNNNNAIVSILVAAVTYTSKAPIPGGCNMESNIEIAPLQELTVTDETVIIDAAPASASIKAKPFVCEDNVVSYESYRLYTVKGDFTNVTYFSAITNMLTVDEIIKNGEKIPPNFWTSPLRRIYSAYPGTGSVYAIIATFDNYSAAYVPSFSYSCCPVSNVETCYLLKTSLSKCLCALTFFIGFFITFFGHRYHTFQVMLLGSFTGGIIGNIILNGCGMHNPSWQISLTIVIGLAVGIFCACCCCAEKPYLAILQASCSLGALVASVTYLGIPDDNALFKNNASFWSIYVAICLMVIFVLCACPMSSIMICYSILGSYAIILPIDYWLGSNLKYIMINTIRRISVAGFNVVTINPPFQITDVWLSVAWIFLAVFGFYIQRRGLNGRLPFPCNGKYTNIMSESNYPHRSTERGARRVLLLHKDDHVYQSLW